MEYFLFKYLFFLGAVSSLGKEQFLALYLSAGVISSFTSYLYKVLTKQSGLSLGAVSCIEYVVKNKLYCRNDFCRARNIFVFFCYNSFKNLHFIVITKIWYI